MIIKLDLKRVFDNFYSQLGHLHSEGDISYTNVLQTTAQTLSGAINEHEEDINTLQDYIKKLTSITIDDNNIDTTDQDYVFIEKVNTNFTISCIMNINSSSEYGLVGLGIIRNLPDNSAINNILGVKFYSEFNSVFNFIEQMINKNKNKRKFINDAHFWTNIDIFTDQEHQEFNQFLQKIKKDKIVQF